MNPKEEYYTPGEPHFYSKRPKSQENCRTVPAEGLRGWFQSHKPQALSLLNLFILLPIVLFVYPYLVSQAGEPDIHTLGPLELRSRILSGPQGIEWELTTRGNSEVWEGLLEIIWDYKGQERTLSLFIASPSENEESLLLTRQTLEIPETGADLKVECRWKGERVEWVHLISPQN